jgi:transcriptional regulator with GAF, ATPase, and Fis domain
VRGAFTDATGTKKGKFSLAHRGSIFLDEIGTMSVGLQAKLLRVLQEREIEPLGAERTELVDVRVIVATNRNLPGLVDEGLLRDDRFYRRHVAPIVVPPLRERVVDIPMLVEFFADKHATLSGKSIEALEDGIVSSLQQYHWPGNVRELENAIERAVVLTTGSTITRDAVTLEATIRVQTTDATSFEAASEHRVDGTRDDSSSARNVDRQRPGREADGHQPAGPVLLPCQVPLHRPEPVVTGATLTSAAFI